MYAGAFPSFDIKGTVRLETLRPYRVLKWYIASETCESENRAGNALHETLLTPMVSQTSATGKKIKACSELP